MRYHLHIDVLVESEARHARQVWSQFMDSNRVAHAELLACRAEVRALREQISLLQRFVELICTIRDPKPVRDPEPQDGPADAGSSC
ncbi:hypothetical protein Tco_1339233 [Tanacetum coccineum]